MDKQQILDKLLSKDIGGIKLIVVKCSELPNIFKGDVFTVSTLGSILDDVSLASISYAFSNGFNVIAIVGHDNCSVFDIDKRPDPTNSIDRFIEKVKPSIYATNDREEALRYLLNSIADTIRIRLPNIGKAEREGKAFVVLLKVKGDEVVSVE